MNRTTYTELLDVLEDEFDWPMQSGTTAYVDQNNKECPGLLDSFYRRLLARNKCNHRDFQNIAVNGARSGAMNEWGGGGGGG
jgi:acyloxyacyl hydrolase